MEGTFCKDARFVHTTFSRTLGKRSDDDGRKPAYTDTLRLKIPRKYTNRGARQTYISLNLSFKKIGYTSDLPVKEIFDGSQKVFNHRLSVSLMQGASAGYYPAILKYAARRQQVGDWGGLGHYRSRLCEDALSKEYDPLVSGLEATTYPCSIDSFLSPPLADARALWIDCQKHCSAHTNLHGFRMTYSFSPAYLSQWAEIDAQLWKFIDKFVISHNRVIHQ